MCSRMRYDDLVAPPTTRRARTPPRCSAARSRSATSSAPPPGCARPTGCATCSASGTAGTPSAATCTSWAATSLPPPRRTRMPPVGPRTSPSATTWSVRPPARGPPSYVGTVVSLSVLHRLAYPAMTRLSRATHRWSLQTNGRRVPTSRSATEGRCSWGRRVATIERMTIQRMEHVGIVVDDIAAATAFFVELGLKPQGEGPVEGGWVDRVVGLEGVRAEIAMVETPDGHGRLELTKFHAPSGRGGDRHAPANTPGIRHVAFAVDDIDAVVASLRARGAELVGEVERYEDRYRLCYVRGPEGIIVELAEQIG